MDEQTTHRFDRDYWEQHWRDRPGGDDPTAGVPPHPYLATETATLAPGTALDAGCGAGAEAVWLATHGWAVTAADLSTAALARAAARAVEAGVAGRVRWVEVDLGSWEPDTRFDLVTTHYAHPAMPQLEFYERIAGWVAPGGTLLVVGHLHEHTTSGDGHRPPAEATTTAAAVTARLAAAGWQVVTADEPERTVGAGAGREVTLHDVVVRARRPIAPAGS